LTIVSFPGSTLTQVLFLTILNNIGLSFRITLFLYPAVWVIWAIMAFASASQGPLNNIVSASDTTTLAQISMATVVIWLLWIGLASFLNVAVTFGRELFLRKVFIHSCYPCLS
jgi:hypothetical protein